MNENNTMLGELTVKLIVKTQNYKVKVIGGGGGA